MKYTNFINEIFTDKEDSKFMWQVVGVVAVALIAFFLGLII